MTPAILPPPAWAHLPFFQRDWPALARRLADDPRPFAPSPGRIFRALDLVSPQSLRVVILGQDPYPTPGNADGLAFSVPAGRPLPASLRNIFAEMQSDIGAHPASGDLSGWAAQGVLLLNTALTVPLGEPGGHARLGWQSLVGDVLAEVARRPAAFVLWGASARALAGPFLDPRHHLAVASAHPSPLSAYRGFFGSRPFSQVDGWMQARRMPAIDWVGRATGIPS